jgi:hypothetical protein
MLTLLLFPLRSRLQIGYVWWPIMLVVQIAAIMLAIPRRFYSKRFFTSMSEIPGVFVRMAILMFRMKDANKKFIHTPHGVQTQET